MNCHCTIECFGNLTLGLPFSSLCVEMDNRYQLLSDAMTRNIKEYNARFVQRQLNPENGHRFLPYIVVIVDEYADLVMVAGKEVAVPIARIAQKARAVGIHIIASGEGQWSHSS